MRPFRIVAVCALATCGLGSMLLADDEAKRDTAVTTASEAIADDSIDRGVLFQSGLTAGTSRRGFGRSNNGGTATSAMIWSTPSASEKSDKADAPLSIAAREILKLRRAVGMNPIAGTIFDGSTAASEASATDATSDADTDERTIAAAVHQFECDEATAPQPAAELQNQPVEYRLAAEHLLRPAERHLEDAAAILEQAGQYDRADAARELATKIRQDARRLEMRGFSFPTPSPPVYSPADR